MDIADATTFNLRKERKKRKECKKQGNKGDKKGAVFLVSAFWKVEGVVGGRVKKRRKDGRKGEVGKEIVG